MTNDYHTQKDLEIVEATSTEQINTARALFREYQQFLNVDLCFQGFEQELASLPGKYAAPEGSILLAKYRGQIAGCVAVRLLKTEVDEKVSSLAPQQQNTICEMKRLYVKSDFRGLSIGVKLTEAIIQKARQLGYSKMQLDTLQRLRTAMDIYRQFGFREIKPYYANPLDEVVYWELAL